MAYSQVISEWSMQSDKPTLLLLEVVFCLFKLLIKLPNFTPKSADLGNQLNVVFHDVQMLFLVNLSFFLKTLLQGSHRVVQVLLLVLILLLDVCAFLHQQASNLLAYGAGLMRLELHAQDLARQLGHVVQ